MTIQVPTSPDNELLSSAIATRMGADAAFIGARAAFWRYVGIGAVVAGLGIGTGFGLYAYSKLLNTQVTHDLLVSAMRKALDGVTLKTETTGEVTVGGTVTLAPGGVVGIAPDATVGIDSKAAIKVTGQVSIETPPPPPPLMPSGKLGQSQPQGRSVVTNFVVFKNVEVGKGLVQTGWVYASSNQQVPTRQYCLYVEELTKNTSAQVTIGQDGTYKAPENSGRMGSIDSPSLYRNCVWFKGNL